MVTKGSRDIRISFIRNFPSGMMGVGLFLLRVITALALGYSGYGLLDVSSASSASTFSFQRLASILLPVLGVVMIVGFATTLSGILGCALLLVSFGWLQLRVNALPMTAAGLSLVLTLLGPGAYSLDARLFGWRRIEIARRTPKSGS